MPYYHFYGLQVSSELALPELTPSAWPSGEQAVDVRVRQGVVGEPSPQARQLGPFLWTAPQQLWLTVPTVARFLIRNGDTIIYEPATGIDEDSIRVFLLGSCTGALLFQRGYLVLHGNAFQVGDGCVMCVGHSGAGKSTLAAAMMQHGHAIIADDVCPVDSQGRALPGMPRIKLWQDSADALGIDTGGLKRIRPQMEKFNYPLTDAYCAEALPVRAVYILNSDNQDRFRVEYLRGMETYEPLKTHTYRFQYMKGMGLDRQHLLLAGRLSARIRLATVTRPRGRFAVGELADFILNDYLGLQAAEAA